MYTLKKIKVLLASLFPLKTYLFQKNKNKQTYFTILQKVLYSGEKVAFFNELQDDLRLLIKLEITD